MKFKKVLEFWFGSVCLGKLHWPFPVVSALIIGDYVEVVDKRDTSVFSLADIRLGDLSLS